MSCITDDERDEEPAAPEQSYAEKVWTSLAYAQSAFLSGSTEKMCRLCASLCSLLDEFSELLSHGCMQYAELVKSFGSSRQKRALASQEITRATSKDAHAAIVSTVDKIPVEAPKLAQAEGNHAIGLF